MRRFGNRGNGRHWRRPGFASSREVFVWSYRSRILGRRGRIEKRADALLLRSLKPVVKRISSVFRERLFFVVGVFVPEFVDKVTPERGRVVGLFLVLGGGQRGRPARTVSANLPIDQ